MGLIFSDAFDSYAATSDVNKKWNSIGSPMTWGSTLGRNGNGGLSCVNGAGGGSVTSPLIFGGVTTGIFAVAFYVKFNVVNPTAQATFLTIYDTTAAANGCGGLKITTVNSVGVVQLFNSAGSFLNTGVKNICDGNWHHLDFRFNVANASNTQWLYVDGILEWNQPQNIAQARAASGITFTQMNNNVIIQGLSYVAAYDSNGSPNATTDYPIGQHVLGVKRPSSDVTVQFTPDSGGANWSRINEVNGDGDTSYVQDGTVGDQDLYGYTPLPNISVAPNRIWSAMVNSYVENPVAGTQNFQAICKSGATQTNGATTLCPPGYSTKQQPFNVDPNGGGNWTVSGLDAANFGVKVA